MEFESQPPEPHKFRPLPPIPLSAFSTDAQHQKEEKSRELSIFAI